MNAAAMPPTHGNAVALSDMKRVGLARRLVRFWALVCMAMT